MTSQYSLYLHVPFCTHRCAYCDFNTYAGQEDSIPAYVEALCKEIVFSASNPPSPFRSGDGGEVGTLFFGGGTPSLLTPAQFRSVFKAIRENFDLSGNCENTIEANPGTVSPSGLFELREIGINRISFGVQSANGEELRMLERTHSFLDVIEAVSAVRKAGFDNLNLDLIYGLPEQSLHTWQTTVKRILELHPEHISAYALSLEHGTPFGRWSSRGLMPLPDPDLAAEMYEWAGEVFEAAGYVQYEISNWAKPGRECRHNLQYWRGLPYLGLGAGAHGYAGGYRYSNVLRIKSYIERMADDRPDKPRSGFPLTPVTINHHRQTGRDDMSEFMLTGLRLTREGVAAPEFRRRFGDELSEVYRKEIGELIGLGLLEWNKKISEASEASEILRLTPRGRLLGNRVFVQFVA
jgi:oxygen-independent coproporphyrinogen-3 oxidase